VKKTKEEAEATRKKIMYTALKLFKQRGFDATRLQDIARETGFTRGAIYWHFKNKMDILKTLLEDMRNRISDELRSFQDHEGSTVDKLTELMRRTITAHTSDERLQDLIAVMISNYEVAEILRKKYSADEFPDDFLGTIVKLMEQGVEEHTVRRDVAPSDVAWLAFFLFIGSIMANLKFPKQYPDSVNTDKIVDCLMHGILHEPVVRSV
jgi:AcrR family transcriptional regulator